ncbi:MULTISPECIES: TetR-like C-terminal domain-containing protein [Bacillus]|uniref:TetR-like C-terminal domain-containing protein n=1 Tax=Bacillus TaxID=1386 RepID=UPI00211E4360|nr:MULTISPECIES: TetR-like C-terminal domain-containing protein [Bacillus]MDL5613732.1 TetR-like C-terminal domain-containing protein [Bacillus halotolerans]MEC1407117.1 TetR-like C-terminal domain-containing protein [Bacillus halotolerans]UZD52169.1 TetR family transcriptional regulator C-terminal domain-containing protein [Bacillus halotolerans]WEY45830.1 TetR-like C-terminal domain-containing protein [Bacillus sp. B28]
MSLKRLAAFSVPILNLTEVLDDLIRQVKPDTPVEPVSMDEDHPPVSFVKLFEYIHEHAEYFQVMLSDRGLPQFRSLMAEFVQKRIYGIAFIH